MEGSQAELFEALEVRALDLVAGGLVADDPWTHTGAATRPYATTRLVIGFPDDRRPPADFAGVEVAVEAGSAGQGLISEKTDAVAVPVDDVTEAEGAVAVDDWLLDDLGLVDTGVHLLTSQHVMVVPAGENGFLVALERDLLAQSEEIAALIAAQGPQ